MGRLSIGELARKTGVHIETIRYFEKIGMLGAPARTAGGHRVFDDGHLRTLKFIKRARELGFAPKEVRTLLDLGGPAEACCDEVREIAIHHLEEVRRKIDDLTRLERHLTATVEQCSGGHVPDCAVIDMLETARP
ncbi:MULTISPECIES: MerR family transcriptional regulator [Erythrobacteraceae]|uniref:MerR family transcriptional regulator n=1 Tax=Pelagerythrobacter aerophilus TaxID=2306995 RepID=A0A418NKU2_9SPHN|nr:MULTISPECIES: helix-turn-helix domain-containing protein [Erythrobacteraceae]RIV80249.1 MerR family transcriptional regulator [Pelagerythrobacter aerophilus]BBC71742.1 MerR family transcriptional regulator [Altererythrobacter sp. B11]